MKTADTISPYAWDFGEATLNSTSDLSYHPVPQPTAMGTGVTMQCSNCHNAHALKGSGESYLAVKKLDPRYSGAYGPVTGNQFCFTCHNTTDATSAGYISTRSWNASTGYDHVTNYPPSGSGHNKLGGLGFAAANQKVPTNAGIACKGCHSEHGSANDKLVAESVNGASVVFDARSDAAYNSTYNSLCAACHTLQGVGGPQWPGYGAAGTMYGASGHGKSTKSRPVSYMGASQVLSVSLCKQCHNPHGTSSPNYTLDFEENLCYQCHGTSGPASPLQPGNRSIQDQFTLGLAPGATAAFSVRYRGSNAVPLSRHPVLDSEQSKAVATTAPGGGATVTSSTGAIECVNCHNPHLNDAGTPSSLYWKVLDADVQPGQVGYPAALRVYATTNTLTVGGTTRSYNNAAGDYNPDHPVGTHPGQPYNPASGAADATADSVKFCLACHDNSVPAGTSPLVTMGSSGPLDIADRWLGVGGGGLAHGNGSGRTQTESDQRPRYPFQGGTYSNSAAGQAYAAIQCTTCHDSHGSKNVYFLREYIAVDGVNMNASNTYLNGAAINIQSWPVTTGGRLTNAFYGQFCGSCHSSGNFASHEGGLGANPTASTSCDSEHNWSKVGGGNGQGMHDNTGTGGEAGW